MELEMDLLFYQIKQKHKNVFGEFSHQNVVQRPIFPDKTDKNKKHIVVVGTEDFEQFVSREDFPAVVYVGIPENAWKRVRGNYIIFPGKQSVSAVFNELTEIFDDFEAWYNELEEAVTQYFSYNAILNSGEPFLKDPIALVDNQFQYISYTKRLAFQKNYEKYVSNSSYLPLEDINYLNSLPDFKALEQEKDVFHYVAVENMLHKNIFHGNEYIARLSVPYSEEDYVNRFYACVLRILARYIERLYNQFGTFRRLEPKDSLLKTHLTALLDGEYTRMNEIRHLLHAKGFQAGDLFLLIRFTSGFTNNSENTDRALANQLEMMVPGAVSLYYRDNILALVNTSFYQRSGGESLMQKLAYYLRDSLLQAGISRLFSDMLTLHAAYKQSDIAITLGRVRDSSSWYFCFDDYALIYLMKYGTQAFTPEQVCHPAIMQLIAYDEEHHTNLNDTLHMFIRVQYNSSECARRLFVNRSSFLKRMERIEKLTGIHMEDRKERVYLELSYLIWEEEK